MNKAPDKHLDPAFREFLRFAVSREGQELVLKDGQVSIPADIAETERARLD